MKRYIKLSLLLLLIPLFVKNVYAEELIEQKNEIDSKQVIEIIKENDEKIEESLDSKNSYDDIETGASKEQSVTIEEIISSIDEEYELDVDEIDNLSHDENSKAKKVLMKIIDENMKDKNYDLELLGYKIDVIWNYYNNENKNSYTLILYDKENKELKRKELVVKYKNSENENIDDNKKIEEILENKELTLVKEYSLEEILSNIKENKYLYSNTEEYLKNIFIGSNIDFFILSNGKNITNNLSGLITEQVVLSINGIIYKTISINNKYITIIEMPCEEDRKNYIEDYIKEMLNNFDYTNIEEIRFTPETNSVFAKNDNGEISLGNIEIKEIREDYKYISGANSTIYNTDSLEIETNGNRSDFKRIEINSVEVNPIYYSVSSNNTKITIKNEFIRALNNGKYTIDVIFKSGRAKTSFTITTKPSLPPVVQKPVINVPTRPYYPHYVVNNNQNTNNEIISDNDDTEDTENTEENKKDDELEAGQDINLDELFGREEDKDKRDDADSKNSNKEDEEKEIKMELLKSRYVPIIIVTIAVLIGGITAYVFLKTREENIL